MTEDAKRHAIEEFFVAPKPHYSWTAILAGAAMAFIAFLLLKEGVFRAGFIFLAIGAGVATFLPFSPTNVLDARKRFDSTQPAQHFSLFTYSDARQRFDKRVSPAQIQAWLDQDLARLGESSRVAMGLLKPDSAHAGGVPSALGNRVRDARNAAGAADTAHAHGAPTRQRDTMIVFGPVPRRELFKRFEPAVVRCRKAGDTDAYLYTTWRVVIVHFTDYFLGVHQTIFNMIKNASVMDDIDECFYRDVVKISTTDDSTNLMLDQGETLVWVKTFKLSMSSGENIQLQLSEPGFQLAADLNSKNDATIQKIRTTLRDFKQKDVLGGRAGTAAGQPH